ncbi:MAG: recombinase family protein [Anaerolineaceae bacterium]|nr:MAG: recombinase family protein [Anaerolineaceae bacterium]
MIHLIDDLTTVTCHNRKRSVPQGHRLHLFCQTVEQSTGLTTDSLQESIDTTTSGGRLIFHVFGALAEFERNLIRERTMAGLRAARARDRIGGRPRKLDAKKTELAYRLYDEKKYAVKEICQMLGVAKSTLYAYLERRTQEMNK